MRRVYYSVEDAHFFAHTVSKLAAHRCLRVALLLYLAVFSALQASASELLNLDKRASDLPIQTGDHPAIALVVIHRRDGFFGFCTSTLIAPDTVLTSKECADTANKSFSASVEFRNAFDRPKYSVARAIPQSLLQAGTENELGLLILDRAVEGIDPVHYNTNPAIPHANASVNYFGYQGTHADGELPSTGSFIGLMCSNALISPGRCTNIDDRAMNNSVFCALSANGEVIPGDCSEDRGGPFFISTDGQTNIMGVLTNSTNCSSSDNQLLAATFTERDNQAFIVQQQGWRGGSTWELKPDDGGTNPPGRYRNHCVATTSDGQTYTGIRKDKGCLIFREHTACIARNFSHVVGVVPAAWTVASAADKDRLINFAGSDAAIPCVAGDSSGNVFDGRWNDETGQCEIRDPNKRYLFCEGFDDTEENINLQKMPVSSNLGLLVALPEESEGSLSTLEKALIGVSSGITAIASAEFFIIVALSCYIYSKGKREVAHITEAASPSPAPTDATAGTYVQEMVTKFGQKLAD